MLVILYSTETELCVKFEKGVSFNDLIKLKELIKEKDVECVDFDNVDFFPFIKKYQNTYKLNITRPSK